MGYDKFEELDKFTQFGEKIPNIYKDEEGNENVEYINPEDQLGHIFYVIKKATQDKDNKSIEQVREECKSVFLKQIMEKQVNGVGGEDKNKLDYLDKEAYKLYIKNIVLQELNRQKDLNSFKTAESNKEKIPNNIDDFRFELARYGLENGDNIDDEKDKMEKIKKENPVLYIILKSCINGENKIDEELFGQAKDKFGKFTEFGKKAKNIILESLGNGEKFNEVCADVAISAHKDGFNGITLKGANYTNDVKAEIKKRNNDTLKIGDKFINIKETFQNTKFTGVQATRIIVDLLNEYKNNPEKRGEINNKILLIVIGQSKNPIQMEIIIKAIESAKLYVLSTNKEITAEILVNLVSKIRNTDYEKENKQVKESMKNYNKYEKKKNKSGCPENIKAEIENNNKNIFESLLNSTLEALNNSKLNKQWESNKKVARRTIERAVKYAMLMLNEFKNSNKREPNLEESIEIIATAFSKSMDKSTDRTQFIKRRYVKKIVNNTLNSVKNYYNAVNEQNNIRQQVAKICTVDNELKNDNTVALLDEEINKQHKDVKEKIAKLEEMDITLNNMNELKQLRKDEKYILKCIENKEKQFKEVSKEINKYNDIIGTNLNNINVNNEKINVKRGTGAKVQSTRAALKNNNSNISRSEKLLLDAKERIHKEKINFNTFPGGF